MILGKNTHNSLDVEQESSGHVCIRYTGTLIVEPRHLFDERMNLIIKFHDISKSAKEDCNKAEAERDEAVNKAESAQHSYEMVLADSRKDRIFIEDLARWQTFSFYRDNTRKGSGDLANAMILHDWIKGATLQEMMKKKYPYRKNYYTESGYDYRCFGRDKFYDLRNQKNVQKIFILYQQFPDIFADCSFEELEAWLNKLKEGKLR